MSLGTRQILKALRRRVGLLAIALAGIAAVTHADNPPTAGLDGRASFLPYNGTLPSASTDLMPLTLSATGVFTSTPARTPIPAFVPYELNSPLWTDGAIKSRFIAIPFDSNNPNDATVSPRIGFAPSGKWTFPNGTVIVKNFDMLVDEQLNVVRRLETRILVRNADGSIRGASYKWSEPVAGIYSDATIVSGRQDDTLAITQADGSIRQQIYTYPGPADCVTCHNTNAGMLLGIRTGQLNGDYTYAATGRPDNQLHTWASIGMFDQPIDDPPTQYARMVNVNDTNATMEERVKSYQASNCSHCHQPGGTGPFAGPKFDMRYETPIVSPPSGRIPIVANSGVNGLVRRDIVNSSIHQRDGSTGTDRMPPIARNVPDQRILSLYNQWVNYAFDVTAVTATSFTQVVLQFDRALEPVSAANAANYAINGATVQLATLGTDPSVVTLTTSAMTGGSAYKITINQVREAATPPNPQNPIWPNTEKFFTTPAPIAPGAPSITGFQQGNGQVMFSLAPPANDGGASISLYTVTCGAFSISGATSPLTVTGLSNGTTYTCSAHASNSAGAGPESPTVDVTPMAAVPDAPTALTATPGYGSATLGFTVPNDNGATISAYTAKCNPGNVPGGGAAPPIAVTGLTNGITYSCSVAATNSAGTGPYSLPVSVTPDVPKLIAVVSRKTHGSTGTFDLPINYRIPSGGAVTVEPRIIGAGHVIVFQFDRAISTSDLPVTTAGSVTAQYSGNEILVTLIGVNDGQRATVSLANVDGAGVNVSATIGFLVGDVNNSRKVDAIDASAVKARAGQSTNAGNFFYDLNVSGGITAADVAAVKARINNPLLP